MAGDRFAVSTWKGIQYGDVSIGETVGEYWIQNITSSCGAAVKRLPSSYVGFKSAVQ